MADRAFIVTVPVATEPIALTDVKNYLRIDFSDDDTLIGYLITRVRGIAERVTGRALATQTITETFTIARPKGGEVSGPIDHGPNWYQYQEQLGANPFGAAQFYFDLAKPPIQSTIETITVNTKITAFDPWLAFPLITNSDGSYNMWIDNTQEPARIYFMDPITANFWQFIYVCGYSSSYPLHGVAPELEQCLFEGVAFLYDNREASDLPPGLLNKLLAWKVDWI